MNPKSLFLLLLFAFGCSSTDLSGNADKWNDTALNEEKEDADTDVQSTDTPPNYWSISGSWVQNSSQIQTESVNLELSFWSDSRDLLCAFEVGATVVSDLYEVRPDPALYTWWNLGLKYPVDNGSCPWRIPDLDGDEVALKLGFGAYDNRLDGALTALGIDPLGSSTFGLFMNSPTTDNALTIFGVAGTEAQYTNEEPISEERPVTDGTYILTALYLLPY